jgi:hypothetical protein
MILVKGASGAHGTGLVKPPVPCTHGKRRCNTGKRRTSALYCGGFIKRHMLKDDTKWSASQKR